MNQTFIEGTPVYALDGEKVGTVSEHNVQGQYLIVHKGWLFPKDVYVPLSAISRNDADGIYLRYAKDEVLEQDWSAPPRMKTATFAGDTGVAARDTMTTRDTITTADTAEEEVRVPVREEELVAEKREGELGRVRLHKEVVEEQQTVDVPLRHEEVHIERVPVDGEAADMDADAFTEKDIEVPVMQEEAVVGKRAHVTEEVRLRKDRVTEDQQLTDTVRKERVVVDDASGVDVTQDSSTIDTNRKRM